MFRICIDTGKKTLIGHMTLTPLLCIYTLHANALMHTALLQRASHYATNGRLTMCVVRGFRLWFYTGRGRQGSSSFFRFMAIRTKFEELMGFGVQPIDALQIISR
uniref:Uncharacterized protein n=1 Tax=Bactrocera dorsalis TaxID=27457 RepID=A0A034VB06_BACDO